MKSKLLRFLVAPVLSVSVIGLLGTTATGGSTARSNPATAGKYTFAFVPGDTSDPFYITLHNGVAAEAKALGIKLLYEGSPTFTPSDQLPVLEALLARHPSALIVTPTDPTALTATIKKFDYGPVVTVDEYLKTTKFLTSAITSNNTQGGEADATACASLTGAKGGTAVIYTTPGTTTTNLRGQGFISEIKHYKNMKVVATEYDTNNPSTAETETESLILGHPTLKCIFGTNVFAAEGVGRGVAADHDQGKIFVAGYDSAPTMRTMLKDNLVQVTQAQNPALEGKLAVEYAYDKLIGKSTRIKKSVLLRNVTITRANMNQPSKAKYFYTAKLKT
jgi:ribose transport system substrate-binding protein